MPRRNNFSVQFLLKSDLGCVVPNQRELFHHEEEILFGWMAAPSSRILFALGYFVIQGLQNFDLLFLAAVDESLFHTDPAFGNQHLPDRS